MIELDRITLNPDRMNGQPCLRDLRLTVRRVIEIAALYPDRSERLAEFPRDRLGHRPDEVVVFSGRDVRAVLLDPTGGDDNGGVAIRDGVADLRPRQLLQEDPAFL